MEIPAHKVAKWIEDKKEFIFLDVRRFDEREKASLGGLHIPLDELEASHESIPRNKLPIIVYCHHGVRSLYATQFLRYHGHDALSLAGGIDQWSLTIDPSIPRY